MNKTLKIVLIIVAILAIVFILVVGFELFLSYNIHKETKNTTEVAMSTADDTAKQLFNNKFEWYNGKILKSSEITQLKNTIQSSNINNTKHKVIVKENTSVNSQKNYKISISYDANGYINVITINEI